MIEIKDSTYLFEVRKDIDEIGEQCNDPDLFLSILDGVNNRTKFVFAGCGGFFVLMPIVFQGYPYISIIVVSSKKGFCFTEMFKFGKARLADIGGKGFLFSTANKRLERVAKKLDWSYRGRRKGVTDWLIEL